MPTVVFQGTHAELVDRVNRLAAILSATAPDEKGIGRGFMLAIGYTALANIRDAYVTKARGGTDEMGVKWKPLSPVTVANRRVGKRDLKNPAIAQRQKIYKREYKKSYQKFLMSLPPDKARSRAKQVAQFKATKETGQTKVETLGYRKVEILRDEGKLLNSLTPGTMTMSSYSPPSGDGGENQVFEIEAGTVTVGTNDIRFPTHNWGRKAMGGFPPIPQRQIIPNEESDIPEVWWEDWIDAGVQALNASVPLLFG